MHTIDQILFLLFAHVIGDWGIWNSWMAQTKGKCWEIMTAHCLIYTGTCCAAFYFIGVTPIYPIAAIIFITHIFIDQWKCNRLKQFKEWRPTWYLHVDQSLHLAILVLLYIIYS